MICSLVRWMVSRSLDDGKTLSKFADRHVGSCRSCGKFLAGARNLGVRLARDGASQRQAPWFALEEKKPEFAGAFGYSTRFAVSAACILLVGGLLASYSFKNAGNGSQELGSVVQQAGALDLLDMSGLSMDAIVYNAESGLRGEMVCLARDARSAAQFLIGSIEFGIPEFN